MKCAVLALALVLAATHAAAAQAPGETPQAPASDAATQRLARLSLRIERQGRGWHAFQGDAAELDPIAFYKVVGRDELIDEHFYRRQVALASGIGGAVSLGASIYLFSRIPGARNHTVCPQPVTQTEPGMCTALGVQDTSNPKLFYLAAGSLALGAAAVLGVVVWTHTRETIDEASAKALADAYNRGLRRHLGLPMFSRRPRLPALRDVAIAPYVTGSDAGLALAARF